MGYIPKLIKTTDLAADLITGAKLADDAIDSEHYAAGSIDTAHIADDQITLAKMAAGTDGNIISYDASGNPVAIATGSAGQVLTSAGAGQPPAFESAAGGGKVVQYKFVTDNTGIDVTGTSWAEISTSVRISLTPNDAGNIVLCSFNSGRFLKGAHNTTLGVAIHGHDGSISANFGTPSDDWGIAGSYYNSTEGFPYREMCFWGIDDLSLGSAWSSGAVTYTLYGRSDSSTTHQINVNDDTYWMFSVMEITPS